MTRKTRSRLVTLLVGCTFALGLTYITRPQPKRFRFECKSEIKDVMFCDLGHQTSGPRKLFQGFRPFDLEDPDNPCFYYWILNGEKLSPVWTTTYNIQPLGFNSQGHFLYCSFKCNQISGDLFGAPLPDPDTGDRIIAMDPKTMSQHVVVEIPGGRYRGCIVNQDFTLVVAARYDLEPEAGEEASKIHEPPRLETYSLETGLKLAEWVLPERTGSQPFCNGSGVELRGSISFSANGQNLFIGHGFMENDQCTVRGIEEFDARTGQHQRFWEYPPMPEAGHSMFGLLHTEGEDGPILPSQQYCCGFSQDALGQVHVKLVTCRVKHSSLDAIGDGGIELWCRLDESRKILVPEEVEEYTALSSYSAKHPTKNVQLRWQKNHCEVTNKGGEELRPLIPLTPENNPHSQIDQLLGGIPRTHIMFSTEKPFCVYSLQQQTQYCAPVSDWCDKWLGWKWDRPRDVVRVCALNYEIGEAYGITEVEGKQVMLSPITFRPHGDQVACLVESSNASATLELWDAAPDWNWYRWAAPLGFIVGVAVVAGVRRGRSMIASP